MESLELLRQVFGYSSFRPGQGESISAVLAGRDALCVMPTGAGKSLCYQIPALQLEGITLVVSPLVSLMKDQVTHLVQNGVAAAYLNSSLTQGQLRTAMQRAREGRYKIIYVAPERLESPDFLDFVQGAHISMVTVDEAHCVSQWGHDFRPSYLRIAPFLQRLAARPPVSAFTATATAQVQQDIVAMLELREPFVQVTGFDRPNLTFSVRRGRGKQQTLLALLEGRRQQSAIVYCATRKTVEEVCAALLREGYAATRYHAGLPAEERRQNQEDFVYDRSRIMVATNAFGMGIDKSDVRQVIHYNMPKNLESYYQEAGRAGRDGLPADCVLLYSPQDVQINRLLLSNTETTPELSAAAHELLRQMTFYATTQDCLRHFILRYFGEASPLSCGSCGNCSTHFDEVDVTAEAQAILGCVAALVERGRPLGKSLVANQLRGGANRRLEQLGLTEMDAYGRLAELPLRRISTLIEHLLEKGYLATSAGEYPVLLLTEQSVPVLEDRQAVLLKLPREQPPAPRRRRSRREEPEADVAPDLFETLRRLRADIAAEEEVPAYIVFSDATLRDMCARRPRDEQELIEVSGVGKVKLQRYGARFLQALREYGEGVE